MKTPLRSILKTGIALSAGVLFWSSWGANGFRLLMNAPLNPLRYPLTMSRQAQTGSAQARLESVRRLSEALSKPRPTRADAQAAKKDFGPDAGRLLSLLQ